KPTNDNQNETPTPKLLPPLKPDSPEYFKNQLNQLQERFDEQRAQLAHQQEELNKLQSSLGIPTEGSTASSSDLGHLGWFNNPLVFWIAALLFMLSIVLHAVHLFREAHTSRMIGQLWNFQRRSANANRAV